MDLKKLLNNEMFRIILVMLATAFLVFLISVISFYRFLNTSPSKETTQISFIVNEGESVREISKGLKDKGLIKNDFLFLVYLKVNQASKKIIAGEYLISKSNTPKQIADIITKGKVASRRITIPEGWTNQQIGEYLEKEGVVTKNEFLAASKKKYDYDFLKNVPEEGSLEGFLFPDTYQISFKANADDIVKIMLANFDKKLTKEMKDQIAASNYNIYQSITLASIVEREVPKTEDRSIVAGIFLKRLQTGMPLQSDVTVLYALNSNKKSITYEDTEVDSPYNTYKVSGLPYGPICNPGLEAIKAVLNPQFTGYTYFLAGKDGVTHYAKTLEEHETNKQKYLD